MTTYLYRFNEALTILCGAGPPADMLQEWIDDVTVQGAHRLQDWVGMQKAVPEWAQCIEIIDAASNLARFPVEDEDHLA